MSHLIEKFRSSKKKEGVTESKISKSMKSKDRDGNSKHNLKLIRRSIATKEKLLTQSRPLSGKEVKRKSKPRRLSFLESLPLEIITIIFFESLEISLPQSSPNLASRLSSSYIIDKFLSRAHQLDDSQISRLLRCNLFTWSRIRYRPELPDLLFTVPTHSTSKEQQHTVFRRGIIIPPRFLQGPWTTENIALLKWFVNNAPTRLPDPGPAAREAARQGLWAAIDHGNAAAVILLVSAMHNFLRGDRANNAEELAHLRSEYVMNHDSAVERIPNKLVPMFAADASAVSLGQPLLRHAILDIKPDWFSRPVIVALIHFDLINTSGAKLDLLDPALWAWADRDKLQSEKPEESNGLWLEEMLKLAGRVKRSEWFILAFCKTAKGVIYDKYGLNDRTVGWLFGTFVWEWMAIYDRVPQ